MRFLRAYFNHTASELLGVAQQDSPFDHTLHIQGPKGHDVRFHDIGLAVDWTPIGKDGKPCAPCAHVFQRLVPAKQAGAKVPFEVDAAQILDMPTIIDCPATLSKLKAHIKANGAQSIPKAARAWLTVALSEEDVQEMKINEGITWEETIACEQQRSDRDPERGSRVSHFQRRAADEVAAKQKAVAHAKTDAAAAIQYEKQEAERALKKQAQEADQLAIAENFQRLEAIRIAKAAADAAEAAAKAAAEKAEADAKAAEAARVEAAEAARIEAEAKPPPHAPVIWANRPVDVPISFNTENYVPPTLPVEPPKEV